MNTQKENMNEGRENTSGTGQSDNGIEAEFDITTVLADLMLSEEKNLPDRLREQEENLKRQECVNLEIGKWLEDFEMPVLIQILNSSDEYFYESFPELRSFNSSKRREFAREVQRHGERCPRCSIKIRYDSEWEMKVETSMVNHKETLKKSFENGQGPVNMET